MSHNSNKDLNQSTKIDLSIDESKNFDILNTTGRLTNHTKIKGFDFQERTNRKNI